MRLPEWLGSFAPPNSDGRSSPAAWRDAVARKLALATVVGLCVALLFSKGAQFLMPGPLISAHSAIEKCSTCHSKSGDNKISWIHGLVAGDPLADSKSCLTCHKMPDTSLNAHGVATDVLKQSTERLMKVAAQLPEPTSARMQNAAFPTHDTSEGGLYCATCHQEHQGASFKLSKITNEQCRSCHVAKFDSFDGNHPKFDNYPFKRRTRIIYDHAGHFGKHYPEVAKKELANRIPATCSTCHDSSGDKRIMAVATFEKTCTACHLDQITGKERVSGPKGIAFLTLPGLDLQTLAKKNAAIGEWPDGSEAELTPFMRVMISRNEQGRALIKSLGGLHLQDLSEATDDQIKDVTKLVWEIKRLFHALISQKASDVLADLQIGSGGKLSPSIIADLTARIPRDLVTGAQQQWLPNLAKEIANLPDAGAPKRSGAIEIFAEVMLAASHSYTSPSVSVVQPAESNAAAGNRKPTDKGSRLAQAQGGGNGLPYQDGGANLADDSGPIVGRRSLPSGTPRSIKARDEDDGRGSEPKAKSGKSDGAPSAPNDAGESAMKADDAPGKVPSSESKSASPEPAATKTDGGKEPADQSDDLLSLSEEEQREVSRRAKGSKLPPATAKSEAPASNPEIAAAAKSSGKANAEATPDAPAQTNAKPTTSEAHAVPASEIESEIDPESWAEFGGWYRQDYAIYYRPTGHKDKFVYSWLVLTGPEAPRGGTSAATAVFDYLTNKDAQGSCTKCHSVDDVAGNARRVNFTPLSKEQKRGRFTTFVHEPHFGVLENRGCLTCHKLEKERPYLKSYEQGNPQSFASNFGDVRKDLCQTCHTSGVARQDCLTCHKYHVNGVVTPIMQTKIPSE